jgi:hypothetical protein
MVENQSSIDPGLPSFPAKLTQTQYDNLLNKFYSILAEEKRTGGNSPVGQVPGGFGSTIDYSVIVPLLVGGIALVAVMKKKKSRSKK